MSKARDLADLLDANGDVDAGALDNVPAADVVNDTTPQLGGDLDTNGNDINFGDNDKAIFGGELQIYSDATHARIVENGTGQLKIQGDNMQLLTSDGASTYLEGNASTSAVTLYHASNSPRLATTATGVDVTGTVTATSFSGDGSSLTGIAAGGPATMSMFNNSGTWNKPAGCNRVKVIVTGGGGGGGGVSNVQRAAASGGGAGGTAIENIDVSSVNSVSVTIGNAGSGGTTGANAGNAGGASSFGAYCSANGGGGGTEANSEAASAQPGAGGNGSGGTINARGGAGGSGHSSHTMRNNSPAFSTLSSGAGGNSFYGGGGRGRGQFGSGGGGESGSAPGAGGAGAYAWQNNANAANGGAGSKGAVVVEEYYG
jgi:hypothetical protein